MQRQVLLVKYKSLNAAWSFQSPSCLNFVRFSYQYCQRSSASANANGRAAGAPATGADADCWACAFLDAGRLGTGRYSVLADGHAADGVLRDGP